MKNKRMLISILVIVMLFVFSACETKAEKEERKIIDNKNDAIHHLEKYLNGFYTVEDYNIYKEMMVGQQLDDKVKGLELMHEPISELMTIRGLQEVYGNRYLTHFKYFATENDFNSTVAMIEYTNINYRDENNINIDYTVTLRLIYKDIEKEAIIKGQAHSLKENGSWLVNFDRKFEDDIQKMILKQQQTEYENR